MKKYNDALKENSDIHRHLPILKEYAEKCNSVLEIGLGFGNSSLAFLEGNIKTLYTIEIDKNWGLETIVDLKQIATEKQIDYQIIYGDSANVKPDRRFDMLFVDGNHSYLAVKKELEIYPKYINKYIGFHDVVTFGYRDMVITPNNHKQGINWAIDEFLQDNPEWVIDYTSIFNNGLLILKKIND